MVSLSPLLARRLDSRRSPLPATDELDDGGFDSGEDYYGGLPHFPSISVQSTRLILSISTLQRI